MCVGDKAYCTKNVHHHLMMGAGFRRIFKFDRADHHYNLAAAWMVMYASAK